MNKKAIELSVNFLVIIIISLAVFIMGIVFVNKIFLSAGKKVAEMDTQTQNELARLLDEGDKVAMPFFQKTVIHGKTASFGVGVLNQLDISKFFTGYVNKFKLVVEFDEAYEKDNPTAICAWNDLPCGGWTDPDVEVIYDQIEHDIEPYEQGMYTIAISPPKDTPQAVYIFNVAVCYNPATGPSPDPYQTASDICTSPYDFGYYHLQKIWLSVK